MRTPQLQQEINGAALDAASLSPVIPQFREALLTRERTAVALTASGFPVATATLATKACRGGGPPYSLFSGRALYAWGSALDWAQSQMTAPRCTTSEHHVQAA